MDDIPWVYVAMIFIAFISWVRTRMKEAAELRRAKVVQQKAREKARNSAVPAPPPSPYRSPPPTPAPAAPPKPEAPVAAETPKTFRELFEMMQAKAEQEPPAPVAYAPPPLPVPTVKVQTQEEIDSAFYGPAKVAKVTPAAKVIRTGSGGVTNIKRMLSHRSSLREALVLKEILEKPISLRD